MSISLTDKQKEKFITYIDLLASVINKTEPPVLPEDIDWGFIQKTAERNSVLNLIGYCMDKVSPKPTKKLYDYILNSLNYEILKETSQLHDVEQILREFDSQGIRNVPLKGYFMKRLYPQSDFRTMGDIDILVDRKNFKKIKKIFEARGFEDANVIKSKEIHFKKDLMYFEIHSDLSENYEGYYDDIWDRVTLRDGYKCSYEMKPEDFYAYMLYHSGKHFSGGGIGIRMIMDIYVFIKKYPDLDFGYIESELSKMGLSTFEKGCRELALNWFSNEQTVINELGEFIMYCSTFGDRKVNFYQSGQKTGNNFWLKQVFIPYKNMRTRYHYLEKAPVLLPFSWVQYWFTRIIIARDLNLKEGFSDRAVNLNEQDAEFMNKLMNKLEIK
ncbi:MAG: nucleotidyltransferase family protein [Ruminococcus sp.]|nr:nucleotidyltransferase family protein [Ruminococcus sp.]